MLKMYAIILLLLQIMKYTEYMEIHFSKVYSQSRHQILKHHCQAVLSTLISLFELSRKYSCAVDWNNQHYFYGFQTKY